jgi:hypothetical protein
MLTAARGSSFYFSYCFMGYASHKAALRCTG